MGTTIGWIRERWFDYGLRFFALGALASLMMIGAAGQAQLRMIGLIALAQALGGLLVCAAGLRPAQPARWRRVIAGLHTTRDVLRAQVRRMFSRQVST